MNKRRRDRSSAMFLLVVLALVASACVKKADPGVGINRVEASLVFGVKPETAAVPPVAAITTQPESAPDIVEAGNLELSIPALPSLPLNVTNSDCPEAPPTAAVERPSEVNVTGDPLQGVVRWKHGGFATVNGAKAPFTGYEKRVVRNYKRINNEDFTYETVQPVVGNPAVSFVVSFYQVNTNRPVRTITPPAGPVAPPTVGGADRGLLLVRQDLIDRAGTLVSSFTPTPGLLLLPLPVAAGDTWGAVGVDTKNGTTAVINGTVSRRQRIDACGDLVDGWLVDLTQTVASTQSTDPGAGQQAVSYIVAPQYGAMIVSERVHPPDTEEQTFDLSYTLAQLKPDPLPTP